MSRQQRALLSIIIGLASTVASFALLHWRGYGAGDFTWSLGGASALLHGVNPYTNPAFGTDKPYPHSDVLFYPLPALVAAIPFTALPKYFAGAMFFGVGSGLLAYAITRDGYGRLPIFLSAPFFVAAYVAQWSPLATAAAFLPWLLPLALAKPNIGLALGAAFPNVRAFVATAIVFALTLLIMPTWPVAWLHNLSETHHPPPVLIVPGMLLFLGVLAWRRPAGRLLLVMAIVPQLIFFYDQLPLWLIPRTWRQSLVLTIMSWAAYLIWAGPHLADGSVRQVEPAGLWVITCIYLPALALVLWQQRQTAAGDGASNDSVPAVNSNGLVAHGKFLNFVAPRIKRSPDRLQNATGTSHVDRQSNG